MKKDETCFANALCPKCGKPIGRYPATSRETGAAVCSDCGTREALASIGVCAEEQEKIIEIMHAHTAAYR